MDWNDFSYDEPTPKRRGGYAMILKYQQYPWTHAELAKRVAKELGLPVDAPRMLATERRIVL